MSAAQYIQVPVPEELVPDVMALIAKRMQAAATPAPASYQPTNGTFVTLVERCYVESEPTHRKLLSYLASREEQLVSFDDISSEMGYTSPRSLPGTLGAFGRRAKHRYGGFKPFAAEQDATGDWYLKMDAATAAIINKLAQQ